MTISTSLAADTDGIKQFVAKDWATAAIDAKSARSVTVDHQGNVLVDGERNWRTLGRHDRDGQFLGSVDIKGRQAEAIVADHQGCLWVQDGSGPLHRRNLLGPSHSQSVTAGSNGTEQGQYGSVRALAVDKANQLYVADCEGGRVLVYSPQGQFIKSWTGQGKYTLSRDGWALTGMALDAQDNVYVVDHTKRRVVVFDSLGKGVRIFGQGVLSKPMGVAVGRRGYCIVSDQKRQGLYIFDPAGQCVGFLSTAQTGPGQIKYPWSIAFDSRNDLWVVDAQGDRVWRFAMGRLIWSLLRDAGGTHLAQDAPSAERSATLMPPSGDGHLPVRPGLVSTQLLGWETIAANSAELGLRVDGKSVPSNVIDLHGDGPSVDDLLAFIPDAELANKSQLTLKLVDAPQSRKAIASDVTARRDQATGDLILANDKATWRIDAAGGYVKSILLAGSEDRPIRGKLSLLRFSADHAAPDLRYQSRVICSGPAVAGVELLHIDNRGRRVVRRLWLWRGESFLREWLETLRTRAVYVVHSVDTATSPPVGRRDLTPDQPLATSLDIGGRLVATAFDQTSLVTDGYLLEQMSSRKLPGRRHASYIEIRKRPDGTEQTLCLRGPQLSRLRWAWGVVPAADQAQRIWESINTPAIWKDTPSVDRSAYTLLAAEARFGATTKPLAPLCDFYNMEAMLPDLSDLLTPDIDKKGFMHAKGNHFVFDDGTPLNGFWGGSVEWTGFKFLCLEGSAGAPPVGKVGVDHVVDWLAASGFEFVRWHHHDHRSVSWIDNQTKSTILPEALDLFHYFLYRCHEKGIRVHFGSLFIARPFDQILPNLPQCFATWNSDHWGNSVPLFDATAIQMQKDFATNLLTSYNPYRKLRVIDDPTLSMVAIENERRIFGGPGAPINRWDQMSEPYHSQLRDLWNQYLAQKYTSRESHNRAWSQQPLEIAEDPHAGTVALPPVWEMKPGTRTRPNPRISDAREFAYWIHRRYLSSLYDHLRTIGYKGVIFSNGDQANLEMRRAAAEVLDATAIAGYAGAMRLAYGFSSTMPVAGKPCINREWGPRNDVPDSWWSTLPHAISSKYLDQTYHFAWHTSGHVGIDHLLPDETTSTYSFSGLAQNPHPRAALALMAGALAFRFADIQPPEQRVELGLPRDGSFVDMAATRGSVPHEVANTYGWREGERKKSKGIPPLRYFGYWPMRARFFDDKYTGNADLVTNLPLLPAGDFSAAKKAFLAQPDIAFDRYGKQAIDSNAYFKSQGLALGENSDQRSVGRVAGYVDTDAEREQLYASLQKMGMKPPVSIEQFGRLWRMADGSCELDLIENRFWVDRPNLQALAGPLEDLSNQVSGISVNAQGKGAVWQVPWSKRDLDRSMLMVSMEGRCELTRGKHVKYAFLMTRDLSLHHQSRLLVSIKAPQKVRVAVKAAAQDDIIECDRLYITPFRPISNRLPIEITVSAPAGSKVFGANAAGEVFVEVAATFNAATSQLSFVTPNRQDIAFYTVERASSAAK